MQPFERGLIWQSIAWVRACGAVNSRGGLESLVFTLRYILWCQQSMLGCLRLIPMHACMLSENRAWFAHVRDLLPLLCMQKRFSIFEKVREGLRLFALLVIPLVLSSLGWLINTAVQSSNGWR